MGRATTIVAGVLFGLLAGGCGKEEAKPKAVEPPPAPPEKVAAKESTPEPKKDSPKAEEKAPSPAPSDAEFDAALAKILALEQEGQFAEAMALCREAESQFRNHPKAATFLEASARLRDERKAAARLPFALRQLTSDRPEAVEAARRELLDAGDAALIFLRKAIRDEAGDLALQAVKLLVEARDKRAPQAFLAKVVQSEAGPLRSALCDGLKALVALAGRDALAALYAAVKGDEAFKSWDLAAVLCVALDQRCGGDAAKLGELLGDPKAADVLKAYVAKAIDSTNAPAANWAASVAPAVGILANGLHGFYFQGTNFEKLVAERLDPSVDFTGKSLPFPGGKAEGVSARWTGHLFAERDGNYMLASEYDDGMRVWVGGKLILEDWANPAAKEQQASVMLRKGFHELKVEFFNARGEARMRLLWDGPGFAQRLIAGHALRTLPWKGMQAPK